MNGLILQLTLILIDLDFKPLKVERMQMESINLSFEMGKVKENANQSDIVCLKKFNAMNYS